MNSTVLAFTQTEGLRFLVMLFDFQFSSDWIKLLSDYPVKCKIFYGINKRALKMAKGISNEYTS